ncbi:RNA polymerase sigma factor [Spirosoma aerophilum]
MAQLSDQNLISLYLTHNDTHAFAQLYTRYRYRVYQHCLYFCRDHHEADDFTQEIFIRLTHKINTYSGTAQFGTWLNRVTANYCIDQVREHQQRQTLYQRYADEMYRQGNRPYDNEETSFLLMQQVMQQLSVPERELLKIKYADSTTLEGIARKQNLTLSAVKMRVKRARERARLLYNQLHAMSEHDF